MRIQRYLQDVEEIHNAINQTLHSRNFPCYVILVFYDHEELQARLINNKQTHDLSPPMSADDLYIVLSAYYDGLRHGLTKSED